MPISHIVKKQCPICNKTAIETSRFELGKDITISLECGHFLFEELVEAVEDDLLHSLTSSDGKMLREYQVEGIKFLETANARALIADEQGLGKTVQALGGLKLHPEWLPAIIVTKTGIKHQWFHEILRWCGREGYLTQVLMSGKETAIPYAFQVYITTADMVARKPDMFNEVQYKTVIIDECQSIKNHESKRAKGLQELTKNSKNVIALSGTPIKNNAGEYFTILNILHPERFPSWQKFVNDYCDSYNTMYVTKVGGIADVEAFKSITEDFIIRRTRAQAAPEIPEIDRQFFHVELDKRLNSAYRDAMKELDELLYADEDENTITSMIAIMTKMRRLTGLSKVGPCTDFVSEFLLNEPTRKLVIFAHHHDVVNLLEADLNKWLTDGGYEKALNLHAGLSAEKRAELVSKFKDEPKARIMIASTLAAGEGLNLQFCSRAIMLERQWNPANEEQAEGRFARIGQEDNIIITYMLASETIDEYFTELVEQKRAIVKNTLDGESINWETNNLMKELAGVLLAKGREKWKLM